LEPVPATWDIHYSLIVRNGCDFDCTNIEVTDTKDPRTYYRESQPPYDNLIGQHTFVWNFGTLEPGQQRTALLRVATGPSLANQTVHNEATVDSDQTEAMTVVRDTRMGHVPQTRTPWASPTPTSTATPTPTPTPTNTSTPTPAPGGNHPPENGTLRPSSGGAPAGQVVYFTTTYIDPDGHADLKACRLHIGRWDAPKSLIGNAVFVYNPNNNRVRVRNDRGTRWWGGKPVGTDNVVQNSQAKVHCNLTTVTRSGNTITVRWAMEFKPAFSGRAAIYLKARDMAGLTSPLQIKGTWRIQ
jgi:hypothetical protein